MAGSGKWLFRSLNIIHQIEDIFNFLYQYDSLIKEYHLGTFFSHRRCMLGEFFDFMNYEEKNDSLWESLIKNNQEISGKEQNRMRRRLKSLLTACRA